MQKKVNVALLGNGFMGKKHKEAVLKIPETQLKVIIDKNCPSDFSEGILYFQTLEEFISAKADIDLVIISTPNFLHYPQGKLLLENQYHILLEKPFCLKSAELEELYQIAETSQRQIFFSTQNRYSPISKWLKNLKEMSLLGQLFMIQTHCFWNRDQKYYTEGSWKGTRQMDGGTLYTQFFHFLDLIFWIFGEIELTNSSLNTFRNKNIEVEDTGVVSFRLNDEGIGVFTFTTAVWDKNMESSMTVIAEKGSIQISGQYFDQISYCHIKDYVLEEMETSPYSHLELNIKEISEVLIGRKQYASEKNHHLSLLRFIETVYQYPVEK